MVGGRIGRTDEHRHKNKVRKILYWMFKVDATNRSWVQARQISNRRAAEWAWRGVLWALVADPHIKQGRGGYKTLMRATAIVPPDRPDKAGGGHSNTRYKMVNMEFVFTVD
jgi:hypothetical protein